MSYFSKLQLNLLALYVRRTPLNLGRWRLISPVVKLCSRLHQSSELRIVRTRYGFRMRVDLGEWLGRHIFATGEYEPATSAVINACLTPGGTFVDVGANAGYFTLLAGRRVGPRGRVFSFEPLPSVRKALSDNLELNRFSHCQVMETALSNQEGEAEFFPGPASHYGISSLRPLGHTRESIRVRTARLESVLGLKQNIDLIKIDVEGAECHVLEGMTTILAQSGPPIVLEVTPEYLNGMGRTTGDLDQLIRAHGYRCYAIEHEGIRPIPSLSSYRSEQFNAFVTTRNELPDGIPVLEQGNR